MNGSGHSELSDVELRVRALESILAEKGYIDPATVDALVEAYETRNGAGVVARAWADDDFAQWLRADASAAIASLGFGGRQGEHTMVVKNTQDEHNLVVCTLCSCCPWPLLVLPPVWYKSAPYRSRAVMDPRSVLADFGISLPESTPRPGVGLDGGAALPRDPHASRWHRRMDRGAAGRPCHPRLDDRHRVGSSSGPGGSPVNGVHDMGGMMSFGPTAATLSVRGRMGSSLSMTT